MTGEPIKLLDGRYGPYVTDGTTNASLPKDAPPDDLTFEQALRVVGRSRGTGRGATKRAAARRSAKPATEKDRPPEERNVAQAQKTPRKTASPTTVAVTTRVTTARRARAADGNRPAPWRASGSGKC